MRKDSIMPLGATFAQAADLVQQVWSNLRYGLESVVAHGESLSDRLDGALRRVGEDVELRIHSNRARLFAWTGAPDSQTLNAVAARVAALESRLEQLDQALAALENPDMEDASWHGAQQRSSS